MITKDATPHINRLQAVLDERGLIQADLARITGKSPAQVNKWCGDVIPSSDNQELIISTINRFYPRFGERLLTIADVWGERA